MKDIIIINKKYPVVVMPLIDKAENTLDIIMFDWRNYENDIGNPVSIFNQSIIRAKQRGLKIRVILQNGYMINFLKAINCEVKKANDNERFHIKLLIIDKKLLILGSHNYTEPAFSSNQEISAIIEDPDGVSKCVDYFNSVWS